MRCRLLIGLAITLLGPAAFGAGRDSRLADAAQHSDAGALRSLLNQRVDVNGAQADGSTALHWAVLRDNLELTNQLLDAGANSWAATRYNITPLSLACTNGNAAVIERLLKAGADANGTSEKGETMLMTASLTGKVDAVKVLLAHGADVNAKEPFKGQTALMFAASEGNTAAAAMLLEFGAQVKVKSTKGNTALLFAVRNAQVYTVETLLAHGANVNDVAPDGTTALNMAVLNAYFEMASVLLDHGANPNAVDARGSTLHILAWLRKPGSDGAVGVGQLARSTPVPVGKITALELAKALLQHGANPNARIAWKEGKFDPEGGRARNPVDINIGRHFLSYAGATPFYIAARSGDAAMMRVLADGGGDPKLGTEAGITPLMVAAGLDAWPGESPGPFTGVSEAERLEAVKLAVELGNDVNGHSDFAPFPMKGDAHYTLLYYPLNMEEVADKGLGDPRWTGCTPLISAVVSDQPSIVQYLVDHGAKLDAQTKLGWTPLMVAERGVFFANSKKDYPRAAEIIRKAMIERGLLAPGQATDTASDSAAPAK